MDRLFQNKWFVWMVYALLVMFLLFMLVRISPILNTVYHFVKAVVAPFIIAVIISYVLNPVVNLLNSRKVPRPAAVIIIYIVFIASVTVILMNLIPMFIRQLKELNEHLPELGQQAEFMINSLNRNELLPPTVREGLNRALKEIENSISEGTTRFVNDIGSTINAILLAFIIPFLVFYMLKDIKLIERTTLTIVPKKHRKSMIRLMLDIDEALGNYVRGQFIVCLIVGVAAYIGYWLVGLPYPLLFASLVAVFNIIPYLGPYFGAAPALIMAATVSWKMVLFVALVNVAVQTLEGNFISPQVVGRSLHMHPLVIIFVLLAGGEIAGVAGLILAVPFFAVLKVIYQHVYWHYKKHRSA